MKSRIMSLGKLNVRALFYLLGGLAYIGGMVSLSLGALIDPPVALAACSALPSNNGTATFTLNVPSAGTYRVWTHLYSPSAGNDSVYMQIDNTLCNVTVGNASIPAGQFTWVDYQNGTTTNKININLTSGNHTVILAGLDAGVGVDKVLLLSDTSCVPTGDGSNCIATTTPTPAPTSSSTPQPTVIVTPSPGTGGGSSSGGTAVSGVITLPTSNNGTKQTYLIDGKPVSSGQLDTTKLSDGTHTLEVVQTDANGNTKVVKTQKLMVENHWWTKVLGWIKQHAALVIGAVFVLVVIGGGAVWFFWRRHGANQLSRWPTSDTPPSSSATTLPQSGLIYPSDSDESQPKP